MFRKLNENDYTKTMDFLGKDPGLNLFQIGDIENYGFDSEIQTVWGSFNENEELTGVLLRYRDNYIPYFKDEDSLSLPDYKPILHFLSVVPKIRL